MFSMITNLKLKRAASEHSPLPPISLVKLDWGGGQGTSSTKISFLCCIPGIFSSIGSLHQSFSRTVLLGGVCVVGAVITSQLISWYVDGSQNTEVFIRYWSNISPSLRGDGVGDGVVDGIRDEVGDGIGDRVGDGIRDGVCWGKLPLEMWGEIGKRMVSRLDIVSFRSVCKKWRSSLPSPSFRFPLVLPPPPTCDPEFLDMPYAISEINIYRSKMARPYMQVDQGGIFNLQNSLSLMGIKADFDRASLRASPFRLRTITSLCNDKDDIGNKTSLFTAAFDDLSFFAKAYYPCMALDSHQIRRERKCSEFPRKLVLISSSNVNPIYARMCDLSVVVHLGAEGRLALLRLGGPCENWVWDTDFCSRVFVNIATYKGKLCTLDSCGRVFLMDYNSLKFTLVCDPLSIPFELEGKSLFESRGNLYVAGYSQNTYCGFEAYKLSLPLQRWVEVRGMAGGHFFGAVAPFLL